MITSRDIDYVLRTICLNPISKSEEIVSQRAEWREADDTVETLNPIHDSAAERRRDYFRRIQAVRQEFWSLEETLLLHKLSRLDSVEFPYLTVACDVLRTAAPRRKSFRKLQAHPDCFPEFLDALKKIAIASPAQTAELREELRSTASRGLAYTTCRSRREYFRLAQTIDRDFPELASLFGPLIADIQAENGWKRLLPRLSRETVELLAGLTTRGIGVVVIAFLIFLVRILLRAFQ